MDFLRWSTRLQSFSNSRPATGVVKLVDALTTPPRDKHTPASSIVNDANARVEMIRLHYLHSAWEYDTPGPHDRVAV
jgi:hypothetical protein